MSKNTTKRLQLIFNIVFVVSILIAGICLIAGCLNIYYSGGDNPYSREVVANVFAKISIPVYLCIALTVLSFIFELLSPIGHAKTSFKDLEFTLNKLSSKKDFSVCDPDILNKIQKEKRNRRIHIFIRNLIILATSIVFLAYALNSKNYHTSEINASMIKAMVVLTPCLIVAFGYSTLTAYLCNKSMNNEISLLKQVPISTNANITTTTALKNSKPLILLRFAIFLAAVAILVYGFVSGGTADVLTKAINICTECIGLG